MIFRYVNIMKLNLVGNMFDKVTEMTERNVISWSKQIIVCYIEDLLDDVRELFDGTSSKNSVLVNAITIINILSRQSYSIDTLFRDLNPLGLHLNTNRSRSKSNETIVCVNAITTINILSRQSYLVKGIIHVSANTVFRHLNPPRLHLNK